MLSDPLDIAKAIISEIERIRPDVETWGLSLKGNIRVEEIFGEMIRATTQDLDFLNSTTRLGNPERVAETMVLRLDNLKHLKQAVLENLQNARDGNFLAHWRMDCESGIVRSLSSPSHVEGNSRRQPS